jgi:hypothetical protein
MMNVDNVLAYDGARAGQAATQNLPAANNLVVFMGGDHGFLSLVAQHGITSVDQLRGHDLSVDAIGTGFAFVLFNTLAAHDLTTTDTHIIPIGGTSLRPYRKHADRPPGACASRKSTQQICAWVEQLHGRCGYDRPSIS